MSTREIIALIFLIIACGDLLTSLSLYAIGLFTRKERKAIKEHERAIIEEYENLQPDPNFPIGYEATMEKDRKLSELPKKWYTEINFIKWANLYLLFTIIAFIIYFLIK